MALVTYVEHSGAQHTINVQNGDSVMRGAVDNGIEAIVAECGGGLACATCHCYIDDSWIGRVGGAVGPEADMLQSASAEVTPNSRLSCQVVVRDELDGLIVRLPETQY